jgi:hypothetical protein
MPEVEFEWDNTGDDDADELFFYKVREIVMFLLAGRKPSFGGRIFPSGSADPTQ